MLQSRVQHKNSVFGAWLYFIIKISGGWGSLTLRYVIIIPLENSDCVAQSLLCLI